jgi:ABC-type Co2+ transport system permease subunit
MHAYIGIMHVYIYIFVYIVMYVCMYVCIYSTNMIPVCVCFCVCVWVGGWVGVVVCDIAHADHLRAAPTAPYDPYYPTSTLHYFACQPTQSL